jgi:hypothetical protein
MVPRRLNTFRLNLNSFDDSSGKSDIRKYMVLSYDHILIHKTWPVYPFIRYKLAKQTRVLNLESADDARPDLEISSAATSHAATNSDSLTTESELQLPECRPPA